MLAEMNERVNLFDDIEQSHFIFGYFCYPLVLYHFLRRLGIRVHVCFGVRYKEELRTLDAKRLEGHAWLLYNGNAFLEKNTEIAKTYKITYCFPAIGAVAEER